MRRPRSLLPLAALAAAAALLAGCGDGDGGDGTEKTGAAAPGASIVSVAELSEEADRFDRDIYWVGERPGTRIELSEAGGGKVAVRYLPRGDKDAGRRLDLLTVVTYPSEDGVKEIRQAARATKGASVGRTSDGAVLLVDPNSPNNAHLAYPDAGSQVEVYSPVPGQALRLASSGRVDPVP